MKKIYIGSQVSTQRISARLCAGINLPHFFDFIQTNYPALPAIPNWLPWCKLTLCCFLSVIFFFLYQSPCTAHGDWKWWTSSRDRWQSAGSPWATTWPAATPTTWPSSTDRGWQAKRKHGRKCATTRRAAIPSTPSTTWRLSPTSVSSLCSATQRGSRRARSWRFRPTKMVSCLFWVWRNRAEK